MKDIKYHWSESGGSAVGIADTVQLPQFNVRGHQTLEKIATLSTGNLKATLALVTQLRSIEIIAAMDKM